VTNLPALHALAETVAGLSPATIRALAISIASLALAVVLLVIRRIVQALPAVRRGVMFWNAIVGEHPDDVPPGQTPRLGLLDRMANLETVAVDSRDLARLAAADAAGAKSAAEGAQAAARDAATQAEAAATLAREVSDLAGQAASSAAAAKRVSADVSAQLQRNGGSSLRDVVEAVRTRLDEHIARTDNAA